MTPTLRGWLADIGLGSVLGGIVGAIIAVNVVIFSGIDDGYEASIPEVFTQNPTIGVAVVVVLLAGPTLGVIAARRQRSSRKSRDTG